MKTGVFSTIMGIAMVITIASCQQQQRGESSVEIAERANDSTFTNKDDEKDADFVVSAVARNYGDIKIAQLAHNKSVDDRVKNMATDLQVAHTTFLKELKAYANANGIAVPLEEAEADSKSLTQLEEYTVSEFDKHWVSTMKDRHEKSIRLMERKMKNTEDPKLKEWISQTLPTVKGHLTALQAE